MQYLALLVALRIVDDHLQHETVDLCLGQRVGALLLDGVLRRHHQERLVELVGRLTYGHLSFLHSLQQCALHLRRCTVNLIRQDEVREDRSFLHHEVLVLLAVNQRTDQVGRQQVRRKLYPAESCVYRLCKTCDSKGLGQSRHTLEQYVTVAQQSNHHALHHVFLSDDVLAQFHDQRIDKGTLALYALVEFLYVHCFVHIV